MPSLAELLGYLIQPRGGPMLPALAKAPSNATATGIPGVRGPAVSSPAEMMAALTAIGNAQYENKLREAQAEQARSTASLFKAAVELGGQGPTYETGLPSVPPTATPAATASPVFGSLGGDVGGASRISDPRGVEPTIRAAATRYGHDPDTAVKVARSEGLGTFFGDGGKSGTAFQLYTGGGLGNEFQKETGLDPLDPKNEPTAIDWAMRNLDRTGWSPYHGAAKVGIGPREGIASAAGLPSAIPPPAASGLPRLDAASLARAQRMENIYGILGKKMPTWAEEGVKMAPGGSMSPEYLGAVASTKKWAEAAPELFTQTQLKTLQAGFDLSLKDKQALLDRASEEQKQRLAASLDVMPVVETLPSGNRVERPITRAELASRVASGAGGGTFGKPFQTESEAAFGKGIAGESTKKFGEGMALAESAAGGIRSTNEARQLLDKGLISGAAGDFRLNAARALNLVGLNDAETIKNTEAFLASRGQAVIAVAKAFGTGSGFSSTDREYVERMTAGKIALNEESIRKILDINERADRFAIREHNKRVKQIDPNLSQYSLIVEEPPSTAPGRSGVTSGGVKWSRD